MAKAEDPIATIIRQIESDLRARLVAGGPVVALEADAAVAQFRRTMAALRLAVEASPAPAAVGDVAAFTAEAIRAQAEKEALTLARDAETRATSLQRGMADIWKGHIEAARQRARWQARAAQTGGKAG